MSRRDDFFKMLQGTHPEQKPFMPITMMFAADMISQPYIKYATEASVLAAGQIAVARRFNTTQISVISDPAVEASDHGASVLMTEDAPPAIKEDEALLKEKSLSLYKIMKPENGPRMSNRLEALRLLKEQGGRDFIIEGWVEGPCAEGSDLRGINHLMMDFFDDPPFVNDLMDKVTEQAILFARSQIREGADVIGVGDAASSLIGPEFYKNFIAPRMKKYVNAIHDSGALIRLHICGNSTPLFPFINELGIDIIDLDSMADIPEARTILGESVCIAGNIDPVSIVKDSSPEIIKKRLEGCSKDAGEPYIVGAGCEIPRGTPFAHLDAMRDFSLIKR